MGKQAASQARQNSSQPTASLVSSHACIQREAVAYGVEPGALQLVKNVLNSTGRPLEASVRKPMEQQFHQDFSRVRIHTDDAAARSTKALHSKAYTSSSNIVFAPGTYVPETHEGRKLITHELAHVVQQASGPVSQTQVEDGFGISHPSDQFERSADAIANGSLVSPKGPAAAMTDSEPTISVQRVMADPTAVNTAPTAPGPASVMQPPTATQSPGQNPSQIPSTFPTTPLPYEKWQAIEARVTPELGINFLEIGRIVAVDVKQRMFDFFRPYDDSIVDANQKFGSYVNIALGFAGNWPNMPAQDTSVPVTGEKITGPPSSPSVSGGSATVPGSPSFSVPSAIGGAVSQFGQAVVQNILDTSAVATAKQKASLDAETLIGDQLTTDEPIYEGYERDALTDIRSQADVDWRSLQETFQPALRPEIEPTRYVRYARIQFGPHSNRVASVIKQFTTRLSPYMDRLKKRLDALQQKAKASRRKAGAIGGAIAGGLIGGGVGLGVGMSMGGWGGLAAGLGIAAGGAGLGALLGLGGAALFESGQDKPEDKSRTDEQRAKDRENLQTIPEEDDEEAKKKEGQK